MAAKSARTTWDWSVPTEHVHLLGYAVETAAAAVVLNPLIGMPWQGAAAGLGLAAVGGAVYDTRAGSTRGTVITRAASWLAATGWCSWALATGPLTFIEWMASLGAVSVGAAMNASLTASEPARAGRRAERSLRRESVGVLRAWEERLERIAHLKSCTARDIKWWNGKVGYTVEIHPPGGTTVGSVKNWESSFASDLELPPGCGVSIRGGSHRGVFLIDVTLKDIVTEDIPYPKDYSELTIKDRFPFGLHRNGDPSLGGLLDDCGVLVGETDAGKTNTLRVITGQLARMPDVLIWAIDITGGGVALPWITPWATEGIASAPIVDWVAHTEDEARLMVRMAREMIAARKSGYQQLMREKKSDNKLPVSHEIPAVVILSDEVASLPPDVKQGLDTVANEGRAMRVRCLNCGLRGTQDVITAAMKLQAKWRVGMTVTDPEELAYLFPGYVKLDTLDAPVAGSGWNLHSRLGPKYPSPFKAFYMPDFQADEVCVHCAARRPAIDGLSLQVPTGAYYRQRWARSLPHLYRGQTLTAAAQAAVDQGGGPDVKDATAILADEAAAALKAAVSGATSSGTQGNGPSIEPGVPSLRVPNVLNGTGGAAQIFGAVRSRPTAEVPPGEGAPVHAQPIATVTVLPQQPRSADPRDLAWRLLLDAGENGFAPRELHAKLAELHEGDLPAERTVRGWLQKWAEQGRAETDTSGQYTRYRVADSELPPSGRPVPAAQDPELIRAAAVLVLDTQFGSAQMLSRKLRIGWDDANSVLEVLANHGLVGLQNGDKARDVLVSTRDAEQAIMDLSQELGLSPSTVSVAEHKE